MPISRRRFLTASAAAPIVASCASQMSKFRDEPMPELATRLGVCAACYVIINAGKADVPVFISGCASSRNPQGNWTFQAASLTKPLFALVALKLSIAGKLDLDAPVARYLPDGYAHRQNPFVESESAKVDQVPASILARIPVASLLNHSSGLPNWTDGVLAPEFTPGERWQYSGEAYVLLQAVIQAVTGQDTETCVAEHVFNPYGMRDSKLRLTEDIRRQLVSGTSWFGWSRHFDFSEPNAAASLYTTAEDYAKLICALLADKASLSLTLARPITTDAALGLAWGYGWGIGTATGGPYLWQWGSNPGYRAFAMVSASSGDGYVVFTNNESGMPLAAALAHSTIPAAQAVFRFPLIG